MKPMCTFDYKEQFWGMWNSIKAPSELGAKRELALFRGGLGRRPVWPDWNDSENVDGGRWKVIFRVTELPQIVDNFWRDLMVHCIEERWVPYSGFVNGVSITVKGQFYRIYVWLCSSKPAYVEFIRDRAKELLKDIPYVQMDYVTGNGERPAQRSPLVSQATGLPTTVEEELPLVSEEMSTAGLEASMGISLGRQRCRSKEERGGTGRNGEKRGGTGRSGEERGGTERNGEEQGGTGRNGEEG